MNKSFKKSNGLALIPFLVFIGIYLSSGVILQYMNVEEAFYQFPAPVAVIIGIITSFFILEDSIDNKFKSLVKGCGNEDIIVMCIIYLLAGAFSSVSSKMGGIDSTVNLGLTIIPANYITAGVFLISAFISISTGTSVGTIAAVGPIAIGLAQKAGLNLPLVIATTIGGAMFGDNLSIISDTTIAATRTQGVDMKDKFKANLLIALPAALITLIILIIFGKPETIIHIEKYEYSIIKILPYIFVLITALIGVNVFIVLTGGIVFAGAIGLYFKSFTLLTLSQAVYSGFESMIDIFLLSMLTGGLAEIVKEAGGIQWLLEKIKNIIKDKKTAELGIAALVSLTDFATANNTVAIIISGPVAREIANEYEVDPRKAASILDIFSCVVQGIIPYGAQVLIAVGFAKNLVSPMEVIKLLWYQQILVIISILAIITPVYDNLISKKDYL